MTAQDTTDLIRQAAAGDASAFARLLEGHYMTIYRIAYKWCGHREDAQDVAQDVCLKLADKLPGFRGDSAFTSWLYRLTINAAKDYYRTTGKARSREQAFAEGFDAPSDEVPADERMASAQAFLAIHALPEPMRDAVLLVFAEGLSHKEAASILGCAEATVSWRIFQSRKLLKTHMEPQKRAYAGS